MPPWSVLDRRKIPSVLAALSSRALSAWALVFFPLFPKNASFHFFLNCMNHWLKGSLIMKDGVRLPLSLSPVPPYLEQAEEERRKCVPQELPPLPLSLLPRWQPWMRGPAFPHLHTGPALPDCEQE